MASTTAFLFPGQGSQEVGMTSAALEIPAVAELYNKAQQILGYDLKKIVLEGPKDDVDSTVHAQPALLVAGLAAVEVQRQQDPASIDSCKMTAGLSLGEYTALVFAGALSFEDALQVVKVRAEAMQEASDSDKGAMLSVIGLEDKELEEICQQAAQATGKTVGIANLLFAKGRVVSGHADAIKAVEESTANNRRVLKTVRLAVSGAFHTNMMGSALPRLEEALKTVQINQPRIDVYANTTGKPYSSPEEIRAQLVQQVVKPVQWEGSVRNMLASTAGSPPAFYELGPRDQVKAMMKRIDVKAWKAMKNVKV